MSSQNETTNHPEPGDRVRVTGVMPGDPAPMAIGSRGTVTAVHTQVGQILVDWDDGRSLILLTDDPYEVTTTKETKR